MADVKAQLSSVYSASLGAVSTQIKASAGEIVGYHIFNPNAATAYVQLFNTSTVTLGTTAPFVSLGIPGGGGATLDGGIAISFTSAIYVACTTTRTGNIAPTSTVDLNIFFV